MSRLDSLQCCRLPVLVVLLGCLVGVGCKAKKTAPEVATPGWVAADDKEPEEEDPKLAERSWPEKDHDPPPPGSAVSFGSTQFWHAKPISWAAFAPDGGTLATVAGTELIHWDVPSGKERLRVDLAGPKHWLRTFAASPDFKLLATSSHQDRTVRLWDLQTGKAVRTLEGFSSEINLLRFSPDSKLLVTGEGIDNARLRIWTVADGKQQRVLEGLDKRPLCLGFSPDGKTLLSAGLDRTIRSFDLATGEERLLHRIGEKEPSEAVQSGYGSCGFSSDGRLLALGSGGRNSHYVAWLYEVETGKLLRELGRRSEDSSWRSMAILGFLPDNRTLVAGKDWGDIHLWDTVSGREIAQFRAGTNGGVLSADGKVLASFNGRQVYLWELPSGKLLIQPQFRTYVRPVVARLAAGDPFRIALHWAGPEGLISDRMHSPGRIPFSLPFTGEYSKVSTLASVTFHVTAPHGKKYDLQARVDGKEEKPSPWGSEFIEQPSFFFTLDQHGFKTADRHEVFTGKWVGKGPSFDTPGVYKVSISGQLVLKPHEPLPFRSGEVELHRGVKGYLTLSEIRARASDQLAGILLGPTLPQGNRPNMRQDSQHSDKNGSIHIVDNPRNVRIVLFAVSKGGDYVDRYQVLVLPDGKVVQITTIGYSTCIAAGTPVDTQTGPRPIERLRVGDCVWGYDLVRGKPVLVPIRAIRQGTTARTLRLGPALRLTAEHPVYACGIWKPADAVQPGELLLTRDGSTVLAGKGEVLEEEIAVFDLCVEEPHNFFAGGVLVHNKSVAYSAGYFDPWKVFTTARTPYKKRIFLALEHLKAWQPGLERLSLADVKTDDAGLKHLRELHKLRTLDLTGCPVTDDALANLKGLKSLEQLQLAGTRVRGAGLAHVRALPALQSINLSGAPATNEALQELGRMASLQSLHLGGTKISDEGLPHVGRLKQLKGLFLDDAAVSDAGLPHLKALVGLEALSLARTQVGDDGLVHLAAFPELKDLDLAGTKVTSAGLVQLKELAGLERLNLSGTRVDDDGLAHLRNLTNLKWLNIDNSGVTGEGFRHVPHLLDPAKVQIVPTRLGSPYLDYLKLFGPVPAWLARRIEEHRAEDYAIRKVVPAQGQVTLRPGWALLAQQLFPGQDFSRFDWHYEWLRGWGRWYGRPFKVFDRVVKVERGHEAVEYLKSFQQLEEVKFVAYDLKDDHLKRLPALPVRRLHFSPAPYVTDALLERLRGFNQLEELNLDFCRIDGSGLHHLKSLPRLKKLTLHRTAINDAALGQLSNWNQLEALHVGGRSIERDATLTDQGLAHLKGLINLRELGLYDFKLTPEGLAPLQGLVNLRSLIVHPSYDSPFGDEFVEKLTPLKELRELSIRWVSEDGLIHLRSFPHLEKLKVTIGRSNRDQGPIPAEKLTPLVQLSKLRHLELWGSAIDDDGLRELARLTELRHLGLTKAAITDDGLKELARLTELRHLAVSGCPIRGPGMEHVGCLVKLEELSLSSTQIDSASLAYLVPLKRLRSLNLDHTKLTAEAIPHLKKLTSLTSLSLNDTGLGKTELEELRGALPKTQVYGPR